MKPSIRDKRNKKALDHPNSHLRILAVDDEEVMGYLIRRVAGVLGYEVDWVRDCETALAKMREHAYDVIVCDFKLPGMTGELLYQKVLHHDKSLARRMIFITGDTMNRHTLSFFNRVKLPYFSKPFEIDALRKAIEAVINAH